VLAPRSRWLFPTSTTVSPELLAVGQELGIGPRALGILAARGVTAEGDLRGFLGDPADSLHDPSRLPDAEIFRDRIARAREAGEAVMEIGRASCRERV